MENFGVVASIPFTMVYLFDVPQDLMVGVVRGVRRSATSWVFSHVLKVCLTSNI